MTYTWKDVGDRPDKVLSQSEKEAIAAEWNRYEKDDKPALDLENLRLQRKNLLAECDWTLLPSSPLSAEKQDEWKVYRQELRDITKTYKSLATVKWPTAPSG
tara:strand:- start:1410 stop:1715 length:306 start_codon:yes stop_codon:yes gene_type:complete